MAKKKPSPQMQKAIRIVRQHIDKTRKGHKIAQKSISERNRNKRSK